MYNWFGEAVDSAGSTLFKWAIVMVGTLLVGFCAGYWVGHGEIMGTRRTLIAFSWLPLLWLGNAEMFIAYAALAVGWYLPPHYESRWLKVVCAVANLLAWFFVVKAVVVKSSGHYFFRF